MDLFFDVDYTILAMDGSLRPRTREVFQRLTDEGHRLFVWSGVGLRHRDLERHGLAAYVSGVYVKPLRDYRARLAELGVPVRPHLVVDDYPQIVEAFGGFVVRPYFFRDPKDREMERVVEAVLRYASGVAVEDPSFRLPPPVQSDGGP